MIATMFAFLHKEWRDHRVVLFGLAIAVPLLLFVASFFVPSKVMEDPAIVQVAAWATLAIAVLAFASDLVPGETRRGTMRFLARTPAGLWPAFIAKMMFLLGVVAVAPFYGMFWGNVVAGWPNMDYELLFVFLLIPLALAPWLFAISCWLPRGALTLPATALVLALFALPFYLLHLAFPAHWVLPVDVYVAGGALCVGAFGVAAISFVRGYRFGGGFASAAWRGLIASAVLLAPAYGYAGYRTWEHQALDISDRHFFVRQVLTGEDSRYLWLNSHMLLRRGEHKVPHAILVDTKTGEWKRMGDAFDTANSIRWSNLQAVDVVSMIDPKSATKDENNPRRVKLWQDYYDPDTGTRVKSGWSNVAHPEVEALRTTAKRDHIRLGLGTMRIGDGRWKVYDPFRDKEYLHTKELYGGILVLPTCWLVNGKIYDPETKQRRDAELGGRAIGALADGRVLVRRKTGHVLIDLATREEVALDIPAARHLYLVGSGPYLRSWDYQSECLYKLDPASGALELVCKGVSVARITDDYLIGIEGGRRVIRMDLNTKKKMVLFPKQNRRER